MNTAINIFLNKIDYKELKADKLIILQYIMYKTEVLKDKNQSIITALDGIINLIDHLQDAVVADGIKTEYEVFGDIV